MQLYKFMCVLKEESQRRAHTTTCFVFEEASAKMSSMR